MNVQEYIKLKKKRAAKLKSSPEALQLDEQIKEAEKIPEIQNYAKLKSQLSRVLKGIAAREYWGKDATKLKTERDRLCLEISEYENVVLIQNLSQNQNIDTTTTPNIQQTQSQQPDKNVVNQTLELTYYIINLAWSKNISGIALDGVKDFLNMSNFIDSNFLDSELRNEHMLQWKYLYDTIEERATAKSIYMCASHLLKVLDKNTDAEIFCKIQKY